MLLPSVFGSNLNGVQAVFQKESPERFMIFYMEHSGDSIQSPLTQTSLPSNQPNKRHLSPTVLKTNRRMNSLFPEYCNAEGHISIYRRKKT